MATTKIINPDLFDLASLDSALQLPSGTTAERPTSPSTGEWRYNTDDNKIEFYDGADWLTIQDEEIPPVPSENFSVVTYTGNGTSQSITGVGFQPDFIWVKDIVQTGEWHMLSDSSRGTNSQIFSNAQNAQDTKSTVITSFDSDGFSVGSDALVNANTREYTAWCWKANGGTTSSNTDGTITSTVQANTKAGFSIVTYSGNASGGATIGHGLSQAPEMIIFKRLDGTTDWHSYHHNVSSASNCLLYFNTQAAPGCSTGFLNNTAPSSSVITLGNSVGTNGSSMLAYCFHSVAGYSKVGSYTGSSTNQYGNVFVSTGFLPAFVLIKQTNTGGANWLLFDNKRNSAILGEDQINPNNADAQKKESGGNPAFVVFTDDGFQVNGNPQSINGNGASYVYIAFAADPTTPSPTLENSFNQRMYSGDSNSTRDITGYGFEPTFTWVKNFDSSNWHVLKDQPRSTTQYSILSTNLTDASFGSGANDAISEFLDDGWQSSTAYNGGTAGLTNQNNFEYISWVWKADNLKTNKNTEGTIECINSVNDAAGFSISRYNGNGVNGATVGHGLSSAPDVVILKDRSAAENWLWGSSMSGWLVAMHPNLTNADNASSLYWNDTAPTNTVVTLGSNGTNYNGTNRPYIQYNFRKIAGFSDFGSYTGNSSAGNSVNVGFAPDFVMIKDTSAGSSWIVHSLAMSDGTFHLRWNVANARDSGANEQIDFTSTGFSIRNSGATQINTNGNVYVYMAFKTNRTFATSGTMAFAVVAGGGGGGVSSGSLTNFNRAGCGGGAGGFRSSGDVTGGRCTPQDNITLASGTYTVTVGAGGSPNSSGQSSSIAGPSMTTISTVGGGRGASDSNQSENGGSGGGRSFYNSANGNSTSCEGFGRTLEGLTSWQAGGGGADNIQASLGSAFPASGMGVSTSISGIFKFYAGGGAPGSGNVTRPQAAQGGGGNGQISGETAANTPAEITGTANTGGGGGGGSQNTTTGAKGGGGSGGSGVVVLRLKTSEYSGTVTGSPNVSTQGDETILEFTASGTYVHS
jgi:hypothetical protein